MYEVQWIKEEIQYHWYFFVAADEVHISAGLKRKGSSHEVGLLDGSIDPDYLNEIFQKHNGNPVEIFRYIYSNLATAVSQFYLIGLINDISIPSSKSNSKESFVNGISDIIRAMPKRKPIKLLNVNDLNGYSIPNKINPSQPLHPARNDTIVLLVLLIKLYDQVITTITQHIFNINNNKNNKSKINSNNGIKISIRTSSTGLSASIKIIIGSGGNDNILGITKWPVVTEGRRVKNKN
ncbi:hypothetical protein ACTA71_002656 [Dictyostelium dimigraforme]